MKIMIRFATLMTLALLLTGCSLAHPDVPARKMGMPLLVVEDFDADTEQDWQATDPGAWAFKKDGERTVYAIVRQSEYEPPHRSPYNLSVMEDVYVSDFVLDVWLRSTNKQYAHRDMCIFFGHQDPAEFYYVHFGARSDNSSNTIHIVNDAPRTPIVKTRNDGTKWREDYHHVRVVRDVEAGTITAYFDDMENPAMTAEDKTFKCGRVGVGSFDDTGQVDRLILWGKKCDK
jgi:hypothetical protein